MTSQCGLRCMLTGEYEALLGINELNGQNIDIGDVCEAHTVSAVMNACIASHGLHSRCNSVTHPGHKHSPAFFLPVEM